MKVVLASQNQGKLLEMQTILSDLDIEVILQSHIGLEIDVEETGTTFEENSLLKAAAVQRASGMVSIADDSGLVVDALDGAPGVYSARYGGIQGDEARTALLLKNMEMVPDDKRTARFVSVITCCFPDGKVIVARGECEGMIGRSPVGYGGFGYDPVFYIPNLGKTFSQLSGEQKNEISHRGFALKAFSRQLNKEYFHVDK